MLDKPKISRPFLLGLLFLAIALYRLSLTDRGALLFPDEMQYWEAGDAIEKIFFDHDLRAGFAHLAGKTSLYGSTDKPAHITLRLIPFTLQALVWKATGGDRRRDPETGLVTGGLHFRNPASLRIPMFFNVAVSLAALLLFYKIAVRLLENRDWALLASAVYGLLANNNVYIRHLLPYDHGLLFCLAAVYLALRAAPREEPASARVVFGLGALTGFAFTVYPGYYAYPPLVFGLLMFSQPGPPLTAARFRQAMLFALGAFAVLFFYEAVARIGGRSYFGNLFGLSHSADGSPRDAFGFVPKYLWRVEGPIGPAILAGAAGFVLKALRPASQEPPVLRGICLFAVAALLFHAALTRAGHWVFYGRVIHGFLPLMVLAAAGFVMPFFSGSRAEKWAMAAIFAVSFFSFLSFNRAYAGVAYPNDVLYRLGIDTARLPESRVIYESNPYVKFFSPPPRNEKTGDPYRAKTNFLLVNFCFFHVLETYARFEPPAGARLIYDGQHPNAFPAYLYEGSTLEEERLVGERDYRVRVYELPEAGS